MGRILSDVDIAYVAGVLDCSSHIGITKRMPGKNKMYSPKYTVRVSISKVDRKLFSSICSVIGRDISLVERKAKRKSFKDSIVLNVENKDAYDLLVRVTPFLVRKKELSRTVVFLWRFQQSSKGINRDSRMVESSHPTVGATPICTLKKSYLDECEKIYIKCKELNCRKENGRCNI